jgi:DNA-binding transcriptional LysR family regulator
MGARLLDRGAHGARLTSAGEALLPHARALLGALEAGRRAVGEVGGLRRGEVTVGGGAVSCGVLLPPRLAAFQRAHPGITLKVKELFSPAVSEAVASGEVDIGVGQGEGEPWAEDPLVLVASPDAPADAPFITLPQGSAMREALDWAFPGVPIVMELGSLGAVLGMLREGMGVSLTSRRSAAEDLAAGRLVERAHPATPITRVLGLVHLPEERLSLAARALLQALRADPPGSAGAGTTGASAR